MSASGSVVDALAQVLEAADAALAGKVERGFQLPGALSSGQFPHLFLTGAGTTPLEDVEVLAHLQERVTFTISAILYTQGGTQEETLLLADALRAAIRADRTLGGVVTTSHVSDLTLEENPDHPIRAVELVVLALQEP